MGVTQAHDAETFGWVSNHCYHLCTPRRLSPQDSQLSTWHQPWELYTFRTIVKNALCWPSAFNNSWDKWYSDTVGIHFPCSSILHLQSLQSIRTPSDPYGLRLTYSVLILPAIQRLLSITLNKNDTSPLPQVATLYVLILKHPSWRLILLYLYITNSSQTCC